MDIIRDVVKVVLKSNQNTLFVITCRAERELHEIELKKAVKYFYVKLYQNVKVSIVKDIGHFTDIRVVADGLDVLLSWSFVTNVII
jgi:hypothetical protein